MTTEDKSLETRLRNFVEQRKISSFFLSWMSGKYVIVREDKLKTISGIADLALFENMTPLEVKKEDADISANFDM